MAWCPTLGSIGAAKTANARPLSVAMTGCPTLGSIGAAKTSISPANSCPFVSAQRSEASERRKPRVGPTRSVQRRGAQRSEASERRKLGSSQPRGRNLQVPNARKHRSGENPIRAHSQVAQRGVPNARKHRSGENGYQFAAVDVILETVPNARKHRSGENRSDAALASSERVCPTLGSIGAAKTRAAASDAARAVLGAQRSEASERRKHPEAALRQVAPRVPNARKHRSGENQSVYSRPYRYRMCPTLGSIGAAKTQSETRQRFVEKRVPNARKHRSGENKLTDAQRASVLRVPNARKHRSGENVSFDLFTLPPQSGAQRSEASERRKLSR